MEFPKTTHQKNSADNAEVLVTVSPEDADQSIYITHISAEFDGNVSNIAIDLEDGNGNIVWEGNAPDQFGVDVDFAIPLKMTAGNDVIVRLAASGSAGIVGTAHVWYYIGE